MADLIYATKPLGISLIFHNLLNSESRKIQKAGDRDHLESPAGDT